MWRLFFFHTNNSTKWQIMGVVANAGHRSKQKAESPLMTSCTHVHYRLSPAPSLLHFHFSQNEFSLFSPWFWFLLLLSEKGLLSKKLLKGWNGKRLLVLLICELWGRRRRRKMMGSSSKGRCISYDYSFKILLIGDSGVGKSSILLSYISNFVHDLSPTIGFSLSLYIYFIYICMFWWLILIPRCSISEFCSYFNPQSNLDSSVGWLNICWSDILVFFFSFLITLLFIINFLIDFWYFKLLLNWDLYARMLSGISRATVLLYCELVALNQLSGLVKFVRIYLLFSIGIIKFTTTHLSF